MNIVRAILIIIFAIVLWIVIGYWFRDLDPLIATVLIVFNALVTMGIVDYFKMKIKYKQVK